HIAGRLGQGTGEAGPLVLPVRRRLQHLCEVRNGRATSDGQRDRVPGKATQAQSEPPKERGGPCAGTQVPGLPTTGRRGAGSGSAKPGKAERGSARTAPPQRRPELRAGHQGSERKADRMDSVLSPGQDEERSGGPEP